jgi:molybdenum cofactor cytidylyltransferase
MLGHNKLLAIVRGKPMIRHVVENALNSKAKTVIVVLGWEEDRIRNALINLPCQFVVNQEFEKGQSSSLKTGLSLVGVDNNAILVLPGDIVNIDSASINKVIDAYTADGGSIIIAAHNGRRGHPILLDKRLFEEITSISEDTYGLKAIINRHQSEIRLIETDTDNVLMDVDIPEDLDQIY